MLYHTLCHLIPYHPWLLAKAGTTVIISQIRERTLRKLVMYLVCNIAGTDRSLSPTLMSRGASSRVHGQGSCACWDLQAKEKTLINILKGKRYRCA